MPDGGLRLDSLKLFVCLFVIDHKAPPVGPVAELSHGHISLPSSGLVSRCLGHVGLGVLGVRYLSFVGCFPGSLTRSH